jgi:dipeptidase D
MKGQVEKVVLPGVKCGDLVLSWAPLTRGHPLTVSRQFLALKLSLFACLAIVSGCRSTFERKDAAMSAADSVNLKTAKAQTVWTMFRQISNIPRCSKHEQQICRWLIDFAKQHNLPCRTDAVGNIVMELPATPGYEKSPTVILQSHVDMVCEKTTESGHDFSKDPIVIIEQDGWVHADSTTLGADNGLGVALALAVALEKGLRHPRIELLFTVDEETGLTGADGLQSGFVSGKYLINLDGEDESIIIGCAGGEQTRITLNIDFAETPVGYQSHLLKVSGLHGGHSGVDIDKQRANAIVLLARTINELRRHADLRICSVEGGSAHNAIPRDAQAAVCLAPSDFAAAQQSIDNLMTALRNEFAAADPDLSVRLAPRTQPCTRVFSPAAADKVTKLLLALPHGIFRMSLQFPGTVETSNNLARVSTAPDGSVIVITTSQRSFDVTCLELMTSKITAVAELAGASVETSGRYPGWQPAADSYLVQQSSKVYEQFRRKKPPTKVVHAGLEPSVIRQKLPGVESISIGPTIENAHSPRERLNIASVDNVWLFLNGLLPALK